jgi:hypothetical protein
MNGTGVSWLYRIALTGGALLWLVMIGGRKEAWDSPIY